MNKVKKWIIFLSTLGIWFYLLVAYQMGNIFWFFLYYWEIFSHFWWITLPYVAIALFFEIRYIRARTIRETNEKARLAKLMEDERKLNEDAWEDITDG